MGEVMPLHPTSDLPLPIGEAEIRWWGAFKYGWPDFLPVIRLGGAKEGA